MLFGQSYQLFGLNSFAVQDVTNTGVDFGLATPKSDYVASVSYSPNSTYTFSVRSRFDEQTWNVERFEAEARAQLRSLVGQPALRRLCARSRSLAT